MAGLTKTKTKPNTKLKLELKFGAELCNIILKDTSGIKHPERVEDYSEYSYIDPISSLSFMAGTIHPDIYATKLFSQQLTVKEAKSPKPTNISLLAFNSQYIMVRGNTKKIRKTDEEATLHELEYKEQKSSEAKFVGINAKWEEMSVKDDTNNSLREHDGKCPRLV